MKKNVVLEHLVDVYTAVPVETLDEVLRHTIEDCLFLQFEEDFGHEANQRLLNRRDACEILTKLYA